MHACVRRSVTGAAGAGIVIALALTSCGSGPDDPVRAGAAPAAQAPEAQAPTSTTVAAEVPSGDGASPVDGLTAAQLRQVVEAPPAPAPAAQRRNGPVADRVAVAGRTVWRITVPGTFDVLSAQVVVAVGGRDVGIGVLTPDLDALVAVTTDPAVVAAGAPVTYRWGAADPVAAGALEVVR